MFPVLTPPCMYTWYVLGGCTHAANWAPGHTDRTEQATGTNRTLAPFHRICLLLLLSAAELARLVYIAQRSHTSLHFFDHSYWCGTLFSVKNTLFFALLVFFYAKEHIICVKWRNTRKTISSSTSNIKRAQIQEQARDKDTYCL